MKHLIITAVIAAFFGCAVPLDNQKHTMKLSAGCPLVKIDFNTGLGYQCYCKVQITQDERSFATASYIYVPVEYKYCWTSDKK